MLLVFDKQHKKVFLDVPVVGFCNGKNLKDYLARAAMAKNNETGICEPCGKKTCLTQLNKNYYKFYSGNLRSNSEKVLDILKCKLRGEAPYVGKAKIKFQYRFNNYRSKHRALRKGNKKIPQKRFHNHYCLDGHLEIDDWVFTLFEQYETHKQLK